MLQQQQFLRIKIIQKNNNNPIKSVFNKNFLFYNYKNLTQVREEIMKNFIIL